MLMLLRTKENGMTRHGGFFLALAFCAGGALAGPMRVQVQSTPLRATPAFLSKPVTTLVYEQAADALHQHSIFERFMQLLGRK
jgi:hypothetical protein